jgi:hypothetical protein
MRNTLGLDEQSLSSDSQTQQPALVTDHLALASLLLCRGHQPDLSATPSGKVLFAFEQTGTLHHDISEFHDGDALVKPGEYDAARLVLHKGMEALKGGAE